ncbi:Uncharacterized protein Fot_54172 [Forsythia ovata]|uniref:Uncharacterized protein n=1 Tax=Forsythia ovata TaxID=205694 RepID=A0ABD1PGA4_9LAMI
MVPFNPSGEERKCNGAEYNTKAVHDSVFVGCDCVPQAELIKKLLSNAGKQELKREIKGNVSFKLSSFATKCFTPIEDEAMVHIFSRLVRCMMNSPLLVARAWSFNPAEVTSAR